MAALSEMRKGGTVFTKSATHKYYHILNVESKKFLWIDFYPKGRTQPSNLTG